MRLLLDFLLRFGWGLAAGLVITSPAAVTAGFFRVNSLVVMGLATFAALLAPAAGGSWHLPAAAAVAAWMASVAWLGEKRRAGLVLGIATALVLAAATILLVPGAAAPASSAGSVGVLPPAAGRLVSGLVVGLTVHAVLLGHWYLNAPGMSVAALRLAIVHALAAWGACLAVELVASAPALAETLRAADPATRALVALRWLAGLLGLPVLLVMARKTLEIPNTQSATGILYVACLAAILGELTAQLLASAA
ncbi:MAG: hypothetical protein ACKOZU_07500 [Planctomycetaceae bacterium]